MLEANLEPIVPLSSAFHVRGDFVVFVFFFFSLRQGFSLEPDLTVLNQDRPGWPEAHRHPPALPPALQLAGI